MYDICSEMEFCAHQPLTNGQCFEDGSDMIDTLINESTATDEVLRGIQGEIFSSRVSFPTKVSPNLLPTRSLPCNDKEFDVYTVFSTTTRDANVPVTDFTNTLLAKDGQWEAESGGKGEGLRQSADDMLNNAMSAQDFLDEEF